MFVVFWSVIIIPEVMICYKRGVISGLVAGLKVNDQLAAHVTRFLIVCLKDHV